MKITPKKMRSFRTDDLGLSAIEFAKLTGTKTGRTVRKWEAEENDTPRYAVQITRLLMAMPLAKPGTVPVPGTRQWAVRLLLEDE